MRTKTFLEENKLIEIEELNKSLVSMTVTSYVTLNEKQTYTIFYDNLSFDDVVTIYKRTGV